MVRAGRADAVRPDRVRRRVGHAGALDPRRAAPPRLDRPAGGHPIRADRIEPQPPGRPPRKVRKGRPCRAAGHLELRDRRPRSRPTRQRPCPSPASSLPTSSSTPCRSTASSSGAGGCSSSSSPGGRASSRSPAEPSTPELAARLADDGIVPDQLAEGQVGEICLGLAPWLDDVARRLARGYVLAIDYGYEARRAVRPSPPRRHAARLSRPPRAGESVRRGRAH